MTIKQYSSVECDWCGEVVNIDLAPSRALMLRLGHCGWWTEDGKDYCCATCHDKAAAQLSEAATTD